MSKRITDAIAAYQADTASADQRAVLAEVRANATGGGFGSSRSH
jgi:hypothetical protein